MITVKFYSLLRVILKVSELGVRREAGTVRELLRLAQKQVKKRFLPKLIGKDGTLRQGVIILVNGKNILHLDNLATPVKAGDEVALFPPGGGG